MGAAVARVGGRGSRHTPVKNPSGEDRQAECAYRRGGRGTATLFVSVTEIASHTVRSAVAVSSFPGRRQKYQLSEEYGLL
jgi:hypothetical protein